MGTGGLSPRAHFAVAAVLLLALAMTGSANAQVSLPLRGESGEMILGLGTLGAFVYSPDGKYIATSGSLGVFLWGAETGDLLRTFHGHTEELYFMAFSPDGTRVLTGSEDWTAKLWDTQTGQEIHTFPAGGVISAAFSPDGTRVLTGSNDGTARIWHTPDPNIAWGPDPADGAIHEDTWVTLSWTPGDLAVSHDVYLGDNFDDVNDGLGPGSPGFRGNQASTFLSAGFPGFPYPDGLVRGMTYYWRVDEFEGGRGGETHKGEVWNFTTVDFLVVDDFEDYDIGTTRYGGRG